MGYFIWEFSENPSYYNNIIKICTVSFLYIHVQLTEQNTIYEYDNIKYNVDF